MHLQRRPFSILPIHFHAFPPAFSIPIQARAHYRLEVLSQSLPQSPLRLARTAGRWTALMASIQDQFEFKELYLHHILKYISAIRHESSLACSSTSYSL